MKQNQVFIGLQNTTGNILFFHDSFFVVEQSLLLDQNHKSHLELCQKVPKHTKYANCKVVNTIN